MGKGFIVPGFGRRADGLDTNWWCLESSALASACVSQGLEGTRAKVIGTRSQTP